jgi:putative (di)nucleoside polyphosphate hydrolase
LTLPLRRVLSPHITVPDQPDKSPAEKFRPCVAALIVNAEGKLMVCERRDFANSWQFPQGGRDHGETPREALARELWEEISLLPASYDIEQERPGYIYRFPVKHRRRGRYVGQKQVYFLCRFKGPDSLIDLATKQPEFRSWMWIEPAEFDLQWLPDFKREVYHKVIKDFFNVEPKGVGVTGGGPEVRFRR